MVRSPRGILSEVIACLSMLLLAVPPVQRFPSEHVGDGVRITAFCDVDSTICFDSPHIYWKTHTAFKRAATKACIVAASAAGRRMACHRRKETGGGRRVLFGHEFSCKVSASGQKNAAEGRTASVWSDTARRSARSSRRHRASGTSDAAQQHLCRRGATMSCCDSADWDSFKRNRRP
jgi:hypothetical protein